MTGNSKRGNSRYRNGSPMRTRLYGSVLSQGAGPGPATEASDSSSVLGALSTTSMSGVTSDGSTSRNFS